MSEFKWTTDEPCFKVFFFSYKFMTTQIQSYWRWLNQNYKVNHNSPKPWNSPKLWHSVGLNFSHVHHPLMQSEQYSKERVSTLERSNAYFCLPICPTTFFSCVLFSDATYHFLKVLYAWFRSPHFIIVSKYFCVNNNERKKTDSMNRTHWNVESGWKQRFASTQPDSYSEVLSGKNRTYFIHWKGNCGKRSSLPDIIWCPRRSFYLKKKKEKRNEQGKGSSIYLKLVEIIEMPMSFTIGANTCKDCSSMLVYILLFCRCYSCWYHFFKNIHGTITNTQVTQIINIPIISC